MTQIDTSTLPVARCFACCDLGFVVQKKRSVIGCFRRIAAVPHNEPNAAAVMLRRSAERIQGLRLQIDSEPFYLARYLTNFTCSEPAAGRQIIERQFGYVTGVSTGLRKLADTIETLRKVWRLPVGSRKRSPTGYWIITDADDFAEWTQHARSAAITQLSTIYAVAKTNFPVFADQLYLDFAEQIENEQMEEAGTGRRNDGR